MASNYTTNYELPLWEPQDSFLRTEFNEAHQKIDAALGSMALKSEIAGKPDLVTGSYVGSGAYGSGSPNALTFSGTPVLVLIRNGPYVLSLMRPVTDSPNTAHSNYGRNTTAWTENGVSWYNTENAGYQMNNSGQEYPYLALLL